jgi:hypothetical protein
MKALSDLRKLDFSNLHQIYTACYAFPFNILTIKVSLITMKKLLTLLAIVSVSTVCRANGTGNSNEKTNNYFSKDKPTLADSSKVQIPVIAILAIPENITNVYRYKELRASGITQSYYSFSNADAVQAALDVAQKTGLKIFVACPEITRDPETTVRRFMNHPALAGYFLADEPSNDKFSKLAVLVKTIRAIDDKHICYINLFPIYQTAKYMGVNSYKAYLNNFIKKVPTQILSFDNYPITGSTKDAIRPEWYENLELISEASKSSGRPFWGFALSVAQRPYPVPTLGALRLQVFSNLAYGAQGIEYFTYWTPSTPQFHTAAIGTDGRQTEVYKSLQQINKEIRDLSGVFLGAEVVSVAHTGNKLPTGTKPLGVLPKPITLLKTGDMGAVVSILKNNGKTYLVIVNHDFTSDIDLTIKCLPGVNRIMKDGSSVSQNQATDIYKIEAGDVAIFSWPNSLN